MRHDVLTIGEAMLRLSPPTGVSLSQAPTFDVHVAGSEANVAVALASLGRAVSWVSRLPDNRLGHRVSRHLRAAGVDVGAVEWDPNGRLGTYFVELDGGPRGVSVTYDRAGSSASAMSPSTIPWDDVASARIVHLSGITPALSPACRQTCLEVARVVRGSSETLLSVDVNHRARLWASEDARTCLSEMAAEADVVVCTAEDAGDVFGLTGDAGGVAGRLAEELGASTVIVTRGAEGAVLRTGDQTTTIASRPTTIVDRLGAGDAFVAGVIDGILDGDVVAGMERGAVLAAVALATAGDQVMMSRAELEAASGAGARRLDR